MCPSKTHNAKITECTPCNSDLRSYEIDYDDISECTELLVDVGHKRGMTSKGYEISPAKMPLMRIRSVEIVFEDDLSTCTNTGILDRSIELNLSDNSDDSTKCVDDLHIERESNYDSVTLNADGYLSDDNSVSLIKEEDMPKMPLIILEDVDEIAHVPSENTTLAVDIASSPNVSEFGDSGRFTEEASSSHFETVPIEDALLSNSLEAIDIEKTTTNPYEISEISSVSGESSNCTARLYEYIDTDSNTDDSDNSDNTATCDMDQPIQHVVQHDDDSLCDSCDLQYDSFIDMGKF